MTTRFHALATAAFLLGAGCGGDPVQAPASSLLCPTCTPSSGGDTSDIGGSTVDCGESSMRALSAEEEQSYVVSELGAFASGGIKSTVAWASEEGWRPPSGTAPAEIIGVVQLEPPYVKSWEHSERCTEFVEAPMTIDLQTSNGALQGRFVGALMRRASDARWSGAVNADLAALRGTVDFQAEPILVRQGFTSRAGTVWLSFYLDHGRLLDGARISARYWDPSAADAGFKRGSVFAPVQGYIPAKICADAPETTRVDASFVFEGRSVAERYRELRDAINAMKPQVGRWARGSKAGAVSVELGDYREVCIDAYERGGDPFVLLTVDGRVSIDAGELSVRLTSAAFDVREGQITFVLRGRPATPVPAGSTYAVASIGYPLASDGSLKPSSGEVFETHGESGRFQDDPDAPRCISWSAEGVSGCAKNSP